MFKKIYLSMFVLLSFNAPAQEIFEFKSSESRSEKNEIVLPKFEEERIVFNRWILQQTTKGFPSDLSNVISDFECKLAFRAPRFDTPREIAKFQLAVETKTNSKRRGKYDIRIDGINYVVEKTDALLQKMEENLEPRSKHASVCYNIKEINFLESKKLEKPDRIQCYYDVSGRNDSGYNNDGFFYNFRMTLIIGK